MSAQHTGNCVAWVMRVAQGGADFLRFHQPPRLQPASLKGERLTGGQQLATTTHGLRQSPRLLELTTQEVVEEDGTVKLTLMTLIVH